MPELPRPQALLLIAAAALLAAGLAGHLLLRSWTKEVLVGAPEPAYYHYDIIPIEARSRSLTIKQAWRAAPPRAVVLRDGAPVTTIGGLREFPLVYDRDKDAWVGRWPVPWNAPEGPYTPVLVAAKGGPSWHVRARSFRVLRRKPRPMPDGFVAVTLETAEPVAGMKVRAPDGTVKDWRGFLDWAQYFHADAFWMLVGITPGMRPGEVWLSYNLPLAQDIGAECHRRGLKFGVWTMSYLTAKDGHPLSRYHYALDYSDGHTVPTRSISLLDPDRPGDLGALLGALADMKEVDYLGLDYIRNAMGGYEMADEFYKDMPGAKPPPDWDTLTPEAQEVYFARKKIQRKDMAFIDQWQWWRAHKVAQVVRQVREAVGPEKSLWAFTLGWEHGWQHGQDPVMMNDAGVDIDSVMLYEATQDQFDSMLTDWHRYVHRRDVQLAVADVIDWPLHQYTVNPSGPDSYAQRMRYAIDGTYADGRVSGVFIHDLSRLMWGRKGPYSTAQWARAVSESIAYLRRPRGPGDTLFRPPNISILPAPAPAQGGNASAPMPVPPRSSLLPAGALRADTRSAKVRPDARTRG